MLDLRKSLEQRVHLGDTISGYSLGPILGAGRKIIIIIIIFIIIMIMEKG